MAAGTVAVAALGHLPVAGAVGRIAGPAESCIVVEPGRVDPGEMQGRQERLGDPPGTAGVDGAALTVVSGYALDQEIPLSWLASQEGALRCAGPLPPLGGQLSWGHELDAG